MEAVQQALSKASVDFGAVTIKHQVAEVRLHSSKTRASSRKPTVQWLEETWTSQLATMCSLGMIFFSRSVG